MTEYIVTEVTDTTITIWDGETKDKHKQPAGLMTLEWHEGGTDEFVVGQRVELAIRITREPEQEEA